MVTDGPVQDTRALLRRLHERIDNDFTYHPPPDANTRQKYEDIRAEARAFAHRLADRVGPGRELKAALRKLEECVMHANAGIARYPGRGGGDATE